MNPRNTLHATVEWKAGSGPGEVEGYASVFGNVDDVGDVVMPGAFKKTISDWRRAAQPMPLTADHDLTTDGLIGSITDLAEDRHGLKFKARFSRSEKAQRIRQDILDGHLRGTSFIYEAINPRPGKFNGKAVRFLDELRLFEITVAVGPTIVNQLAGVTSAKSASDDGGWLESMRHAVAITDNLARKAAIDVLVRGYTTDPAADPGDAPATATDAVAETGDTSTSDDAYALSVLTGPSDGTPTGEPPGALPGPLVELEHQRSVAQIDALEADIRAALEG
jgi:HK97 family phage prohead protease